MPSASQLKWPVVTTLITVSVTTLIAVFAMNWRNAVLTTVVPAWAAEEK